MAERPSPSVVFDTSFLMSLLSRNLPVPTDPDTGKPIEIYYERLDNHLQSLQEKEIKILIPTPVLSEILVKTDLARQIFEILLKKSTYRIVPFDEQAAGELASMTRKAMAQGDKSCGFSQPWQKVKFDRQIIAIARVQGSNTIYSNDKKLRKAAENIGMHVISSWELPQPPPP